jgi:hypothetical protein
VESSNRLVSDDDQIETAIHVKFYDLSNGTQHVSSRGSSSTTDILSLDADGDKEHGKTAGGESACCRRESTGLVDCMACLKSESSRLLVNIAEADVELALRIQATLDGAGPSGLGIQPLLV